MHDVNDDDQNCQDDGDESRQQTKLAEGLDDDRLQVEKPNCSHEHQRDDHSQQFSHSFVTKSGKRGETENDEVRSRANKGERYTANASVWAAEYLRTAGDDSATYTSARQMLNCEIDGVNQTDQGNESGDAVKHRRSWSAFRCI